MRIILHTEDGEWWADGPDHNYTAAAPRLAQVKDLCREACVIEQWGEPEWELCPCATGGECAA